MPGSFGKLRFYFMFSADGLTVHCLAVPLDSVLEHGGKIIEAIGSDEPVMNLVVAADPRQRQGITDCDVHATEVSVSL